ncbi:MAG: hypothetical protein RIR26_594, partial [Pseudomonadota bacterium]
MSLRRIYHRSLPFLAGSLLFSCGEKNSNLADGAFSAYSEPMEEFDDDLEGLALSGRRRDDEKKSKKQKENGENNKDKKETRKEKKDKNKDAVSTKAGKRKKDALQEKKKSGGKTGQAVGAVVAKTQSVASLGPSEEAKWNRSCSDAAAAFNTSLAEASSAAVFVRTVKHPLICYLNLRGNQLVVQSLRVPGMSEGDVIKVRGEMGYTNDVATEKPQAGSIDYKGENRYTVEVTASIIQAIDGNSSSGASLASGTTRTSPVQHHGVVSAMGEMSFNPLGGDFFNFVVSTAVVGNSNVTGVAKRKNENARTVAPSEDPMLYIEQGSNRTKLDVLVLRNGWQNSFNSTDISSSPEQVKEISVRRGNRYVVVSVPLDAVKAGEVFDVEGKLNVRSRRSDGPQLATGEIVLSDSPQNVSGESVTVKFGENLPSNASGSIRRTGAIAVTKNYPQAWINFVANTMSDNNSDGYYDV